MLPSVLLFVIQYTGKYKKYLILPVYVRPARVRVMRQSILRCIPYFEFQLFNYVNSLMDDYNLATVDTEFIMYG